MLIIFNQEENEQKEMDRIAIMKQKLESSMRKDEDDEEGIFIHFVMIEIIRNAQHCR